MKAWDVCAVVPGITGFLMGFISNDWYFKDYVVVPLLVISIPVVVAGIVLSFGLLKRAAQTIATASIPSHTPVWTTVLFSFVRLAVAPFFWTVIGTSSIYFVSRELTPIMTVSATMAGISGFLTIIIGAIYFFIIFWREKRPTTY